MRMFIMERMWVTDVDWFWITPCFIPVSSQDGPLQNEAIHPWTHFFVNISGLNLEQMDRNS